VVQREIEAHVKNIRYAKVMMSLADIVDGDFFTTYVKKGVFVGNIIRRGGAR